MSIIQWVWYVSTNIYDIMKQRPPHEEYCGFVGQPMQLFMGLWASPWSTFMFCRLDDEKYFHGLAHEIDFRGLANENDFRGLAYENHFRGLAYENYFRGLTHEKYFCGLAPEGTWASWLV